MAKAPRFVIRVSDSDRLETAWTHCEAWCRSLELFRPGVTVSCVDTEAGRQVEEQSAAEETRTDCSPPAAQP